MATEKDLIKMMEKLVEEKTFSLEGAKAVAELKRLTEATQDKLKEYETRIGLNLRQIEELKRIQRDESSRIEEYQKREKAIEDREKSMNAYDIRVAVAEARHGVLYDVFNTIFKNTIVREDVQKRAVVSTPSPYVGNPPITSSYDGGSETKTTQTE